LISLNAILDRLGRMVTTTKESVMMSWHNWSAGWSDGYFGAAIVMHLVWYGALVGLAAVIATFLMRRSGSGAGRPGALDVLKVRYAKGELSKDDFDRMRKDILV
jgi:putative membrane protein